MKHAIAILIAFASFVLTANSGPNVARYAATRGAAAADPYQTDPYAANLIARYDFEGGATDTSGNGQDLTVSGAVNSYAYTNAYGRPEGVYYFDQSDDNLTRLLSAGDKTLWSNAMAVVSIWIKGAAVPTATQIPYTLQETNGVTANCHYISYRTTTNLQSTLLSGIIATPTGGVPPNEWRHLVLQNSSTLGSFLYLDGSLVASNVVPAGKKTYAGVIGGMTLDAGVSIGGTYLKANDYGGWIDNVKVYGGTTCSVAHVSWLYTNTCPTNCLEAR